MPVAGDFVFSHIGSRILYEVRNVPKTTQLDGERGWLCDQTLHVGNLWRCLLLRGSPNGVRTRSWEKPCLSSPLDLLPVTLASEWVMVTNPPCCLRQGAHTSVSSELFKGDMRLPGHLGRLLWHHLRQQLKSVIKVLLQMQHNCATWNSLREKSVGIL